MQMNLLGYAVRKSYIAPSTPTEKYHQNNNMLLFVDDDGTMYVKYGDTTEEITLLYRVDNDIFGTEVHSVPYFFADNFYYELSDFEDISKGRRTDYI